MDVIDDWNPSNIDGIHYRLKNVIVNGVNWKSRTN
jgi:hypothetical protein